MLVSTLAIFAAVTSLLVATCPRSLDHIRPVVTLLTIGVAVVGAILGSQDKSVATGTLLNVLISIVLWGVMFSLWLILVKHTSEALSERWNWLNQVHQFMRGNVAVDIPISHAPPLLPRMTLDATVNKVQQSIQLLRDDVYVIDLHGCIDKEMFEFMRRECQSALNSCHDFVSILLNSCGGDTDAHFMIRRLIQELAREKRVEIIVTGQCASAAIGILLAVPLEQRTCYDHATFMAHTASNDYGITESTKLVNESLIQMYVRESNVDEASMRHLYRSKKDFWFDATTARQLGFIGAIL